MMGTCEECGRFVPIDEHHVVFKKMGGMNGLDFPLNMKRLGNSFGCDHHEGKCGPHKNRNKDLEYKIELQYKLQQVLEKEYYTVEEVIKILEMKKDQAHAAFKRLKWNPNGYIREDIIKRLMGDRMY